jgi:hypothetical protein
MRRLFRLLPLVLLTAALGVSAASAQSSATERSVSESSAATAVDRQPAAATSQDARREDAEDTGLTPADVRNVMLGRTEASGSAETAAATLSLPEPNPEFPRQDAENNRRIYYIVEGTLVATGLVVGILALNDGGGGGGSNIPAPPGSGRPPQP